MLIALQVFPLGISAKLFSMIVVAEVADMSVNVFYGNQLVIAFRDESNKDVGKVRPPRASALKGRRKSVKFSRHR